MPAPRRADRVARELLRELSDLLRKEVKDPRAAAVTLTRAEVTDDLREAKVFFTPLGKVGDAEAIAEATAGLRAAAGFLQGRVGRQMHLRRTPRLTFRYDDGVENLLHVHELLAQGAATGGGEDR